MALKIKKKLLISGFKPFAELKTNPTEQLVKDISEVTSSEYHFETVVLPVSYQKAFVTLKKQIDLFKPEMVIATGVAAQRQYICIERVAINCESTSLADNDGRQVYNKKIDPNGPDGLFTNWPLDKLQQLCLLHPEVLKISNTAGTYVCNSVMYQLLLDAKANDYQAGFVHFPFPNQESHLQQRDFIPAILKIISKLYEQ